MLDGNSHLLRTCRGKWDFSEINFKFANALVLNKYLKQIEIPILLQTCTPISSASSDIDTTDLHGMKYRDLVHVGS